MRGLDLSLRDYAKGGAILVAASAVMWTFMIRPYSFDWRPTGEALGEVKTLMSNSNVIGAAHINAIITLDGGQQTVVQVPLRSNVRAGSAVVLEVQTDADNLNRKRYQYKRLE